MGEQGVDHVTGKVKGTLLLARMRYLRARGEETTQRILRRLPEVDQTLLRGMLLPSSWYPAVVLQRIDTAAAALLARGDRRHFFVELGRFSAETNLGPTGVQRPYLREGEPQFLLRHVPLMYAAQHEGGRRTYEQAGDRAAVLRTFDSEQTDADDCLTAVGWLQRAVELSGGRNVRVLESQCRVRGAPHCEYRCEWE